MRKPMRRDCTDDEGHFNHECFEEACGQYADLKRDEELEKAWEEEEKYQVKTYLKCPKCKSTNIKKELFSSDWEYVCKDCGFWEHKDKFVCSE